MFRTLLSDASIKKELNDRHKKVKVFMSANISDTSLFDTLKYEAERLEFYDCVFTSEMLLNNKQFNKGIYFNRCEFEKGLSLSDIKYVTESDNCSIEIENSIINNGLFIQNCKQKNIVLNKINGIKGLFYSNNQCFQKLTVKGINLDNLSLSQSAMTSLEIDKVSCKDFYFLGNYYTDFFIQDSEIRFNQQSLLNSESYQELSVSNYGVYFKDSVLINSFITNLSCNKKVNLYFTDCTFKDKCAIYLLTEIATTPANQSNQTLPTYNLKLENINSDQTIDIGGLDEGDTHSIDIVATRHSQGGYRISRANIHNLLLQGDYTNTYLNLDRLKIGTAWLFLQYTGNEKSKFSNISTSKAILEFYESDFNKTNFSDIDFRQFSKIQIWASQFRMAVFDNINWFRIDQIEFGELTKGSEQYLREFRRLFQQLKQSCEKNDDKQNALYFHSLEEKYHLKTLRKRPFKPELIRLLLKSTNSFGNNWIRPIICLLILSFISSIILLLISLPKVSGTSVIAVAKEIYPYATYQPYLFIQLINPTHSINEVIENGKGVITPGFGTSLIDILHKIFSTFLIFQTITAFRRQHT